MRANKGDGAELRREIVGFRAAHFNDALAREADRLLTELPSPLDRLDRSKIDKLQKFEWQPREVVAVLGAWKIASDSKPWRTLAFAPDASWLVAGGEETPLRAWSTGGPLFPLKLGGAPARSTLIAVSPDGGQFATAGSDGVLRLWDVTARTQRAFERHPRPVVGLAYHPAGDRLATACGDGKIRLWDIATGKRLHVWEAGADVAALAFTPNGRDLFWALRTGNLCCADPQRPETAPRRFPHKRGALRRLAFDRDGQRLIGVGADGSVTQWVWNGAGLREVASVKGHDKGAHDIAFAPDGQTFVTVGEDGFVKHWDAATHRPQRSWELRWPVLGVAFAADGRHFATANSNGTIYIFRLESTTALARK
ncbi:MAG: WD40 repeat domain-containing protein [Gemmataceae bacterium]